MMLEMARGRFERVQNIELFLLRDRERGSREREREGGGGGGGEKERALEVEEEIDQESFTTNKDFIYKKKSA